MSTTRYWTANASLPPWTATRPCGYGPHDGRTGPGRGRRARHRPGAGPAAGRRRRAGSGRVGQAGRPGAGAVGRPRPQERPDDAVSVAVAARTQTINRLYRLLMDLVAGGARRNLTAKRAAVLLAGVTPAGAAGGTRWQLAGELVPTFASSSSGSPNVSERSSGIDSSQKVPASAAISGGSRSPRARQDPHSRGGRLPGSAQLQPTVLPVARPGWLASGRGGPSAASRRTPGDGG
jgi:hypothetical protein